MGIALNDISFHLARGEFLFLTGPSGSGKSTVLRLVYADDLPTHGDVSVTGISTRSLRRGDIPALRRKLGIVFQDYRLLEDRSTEANIAFAMEVTGVPRATIAPKVSRLLTQVGLVSKATSHPQELSGGEQQRVAIARALVNDPVVLIADEPTGNLDDRATRGIFQLLREINASGTAVVMATHNLDLIRRSEYRTIELNHGQVVFDSGEQTPTPTPSDSAALS